VTGPGTGGLPPPPLNAPGAIAPVTGVQAGLQQSIILANIVIIYGTSAGLFVYNGTPQLGNPPIAWITNSSTDPYGNAVGSVAGFGIPTGARAQFDASGDLGIHNAAGLLIDFIYTGDGSVRFYNSSGIGAGNLVASISPVAGTDSAGNDYLPGITFYGTNGSYIELTDYGSVATLALSGGLAAEQTPGRIAAAVQGTSPAQYENLQMLGPQLQSPYEDFAWIGMQSSYADGSVFAGASLLYADRSLAEHVLLTWGEGGTIIDYAQVTAAQPGAVLTQENWHYVGQAGQPAFAADWGNYGHGANALAFKLLAEYDQVLIMGTISPNPATTAPVFTLPPAYWPSATQFITGINISAGGACFLQIQSATAAPTPGSVEFGGMAQTTGDGYAFTGIYNLNI
jgi:hypothetical protein